MEFKEKLEELKKIIPIRFRVGSGIGAYVEKDRKKVYKKYRVLPYVDSRDCQDRLDQVMGADRSRTYKDIASKAYCEVALRDGTKRIPRSDVWEATAIAREKWEASDSFKRACVNWGLWRFLYTMPKFQLTAEEIWDNFYTLTAYVKKKYNKDMKERMEKSGFEIADLESKYDEEDPIEDDLPEIPTEDAMSWLTKVK